jgi:hypothetical protein
VAWVASKSTGHPGWTQLRYQLSSSKFWLMYPTSRYFSMLYIYILYIYDYVHIMHDGQNLDIARWFSIYWIAVATSGLVDTTDVLCIPRCFEFASHEPLIPLICLHPLAVTGSHSHFPGFLESAKARGKVLGAKFGIVSTDVSCFSIGPTVWCIWKTDSINAWPGRI